MRPASAVAFLVRQNCPNLLNNAADPEFRVLNVQYYGRCTCLRTGSGSTGRSHGTHGLRFLTILSSVVASMQVKRPSSGIPSMIHLR